MFQILKVGLMFFFVILSMKSISAHEIKFGTTVFHPSFANNPIINKEHKTAATFSFLLHLHHIDEVLPQIRCVYKDFYF